MKWTLAQLHKMPKPIVVNENIDLKKALADVDDIYDVHTVTVSGEGHEIDIDTYMFSLHVETTLVLQCSVTLDPVTYPLSFDFDEVFSTQIDIDDRALLIEGITLDLVPHIAANIVLNIPMKIVSEGAEDIYESSDDQKDQPKANNPFAALKDYYK